MRSVGRLPVRLAAQLLDVVLHAQLQLLHLELLVHQVHAAGEPDQQRQAGERVDRQVGRLPGVAWFARAQKENKTGFRFKVGSG